MIEFYPGFDIAVDEEQLTFIYGDTVFGPPVERRHLDDIRSSLRNPETEGPDIPYVVAMDVGKKKDSLDLEQRFLLYGAMIYSKGSFGKEPVRSQGHIHAVSPSCSSSTAEVYEVWGGRAIIYMQETAQDIPGKCYAVSAEAGEVVIVPPGWAHYTVNADPDRNMTFGAWCIRDYGFDYEQVRAHGGLAYFPILNENKKIFWETNPRYHALPVVEKKARAYSEFGLASGVPIYTQYEQDPECFHFVTQPAIAQQLWEQFEP